MAQSYLEYCILFTPLSEVLSEWCACPDSGRLCPMDTAAGQGFDLIASTRDRKENRSASVSLGSEAGTVAFWERYTSCSGHRPSYSLPLAWHEINCAPLKPFKGRHLPLCILLLWSLLSLPHGMWCGTYGWTQEVSGSHTLH